MPNIVIKLFVSGAWKGNSRMFLSNETEKICRIIMNKQNISCHVCPKTSAKNQPSSLCFRFETARDRGEKQGVGVEVCLLNSLKTCWEQGCVVLDSTWPCLSEHQHPRTFSLLASSRIKPKVRVVCASLYPITTQQVLPRPESSCEVRELQ